MNSEPSAKNTGTVDEDQHDGARRSTAPLPAQRPAARPARRAGSRNRLTGCSSSEWMRPTSTVLAPGTSQRGLNSKRRRRVKSEPQRRVERDGQERRHDHRQRLRVGERLEQPAFLRLEREHRQERDRDHQQREEAGRRHLLHRLDDHRRVVDRLARPARAPPASCASAPPRRSRRPPVRPWRWRCRRAT